MDALVGIVIQSPDEMPHSETRLYILKLNTDTLAHCQITKATRTDKGWKLSGKLGSDDSSISQEAGLVILTDVCSALIGTAKAMDPSKIYNDLLPTKGTVNKHRALIPDEKTLHDK